MSKKIFALVLGSIALLSSPAFASHGGTCFIGIQNYSYLYDALYVHTHLPLIVYKKRVSLAQCQQIFASSASGNQIAFWKAGSTYSKNPIVQFDRYGRVTRL